MDAAAASAMKMRYATWDDPVRLGWAVKISPSIPHLMLRDVAGPHERIGETLLACTHVKPCTQVRNRGFLDIIVVKPSAELCRARNLLIALLEALVS